MSRLLLLLGNNLRRQLQTAGTAFILPPLEDTFSSCTNYEVNCNDMIAASFIPADVADHFAASLLQTLEQLTWLGSLKKIELPLNQVIYPISTIFAPSLIQL